MGWKKDNSALARGVQQLSQWGPSSSNLYYNYYATQVMRHWEGSMWKKWNGVMRDHLVNSQATKGHEAGSWFIDSHQYVANEELNPDFDYGAAQGGRLYCTSMATMILEVYYRHLPIYRKQSTQDVFSRDSETPLPKRRKPTTRRRAPKR